MDAIVVWDSWIALVDTSYHGQALVRHVCAAKTMLRMYPALGYVCSLKTRKPKDAILDCRSW